MIRTVAVYCVCISKRASGMSPDVRCSSVDELFQKSSRQGGGWKGRSYPSPAIMQTMEAQALLGLRFLVLL